jgi:uncharacterized NAD(P)/FAD-binding protein YdhS
MSDHRPRHVVIVGGGASGALMAAHLLRGGQPDIGVTIVEKRSELGRGLAYATGNASHLLNVRAANMSAFADDPGHFSRWLATQGAAPKIPGGDGFRFVSRQLYGLYLESLVSPYMRADGGPPALRFLCDEARAATSTAAGVEVALKAGGAVQADIAILACGHESVLDEGPFSISPWAEPVGAGAPPDSTLLILGTGLTMVDTVLALQERGHRGRIVAISRRGLLPHAHRAVDAFGIDADSAPFDKDIATMCRWLRALARQCEAEGGDWRSIVDGLRPHTQAIWRAMTLPMRRRFLEHARPWWDIHRHRMAPEVADRLRALVAGGQVEIVAGNIAEVAVDGEGARVTIRRRGAHQFESLAVARVISCKGVTARPSGGSNRLVESLFAQGLARLDPLRIGIDVDANCAIVDESGRASGRLFAIGPMSQAAFWEIIAVPDIRLQAAELSQRLKERAPIDQPDGAGNHGSSSLSQ